MYPKKVRIICTDRDATDLSSDENDSFYPLRNLQHRFLVEEILMSSAECMDPESTSDSEVDEPKVPSYHPVFTTKAMQCLVSYASPVEVA